MGPGQLYQDLQNLLHDLNVVGQISQLIGNLRGNYQVTSEPRLPTLFLVPRRRRHVPRGMTTRLVLVCFLPFPVG